MLNHLSDNPDCGVYRDGELLIALYPFKSPSWIDIITNQDVLRGVRRLVLPVIFRPGDIEKLSNAPTLAGIEQVFIRCTSIRANELELLLCSQHLQGLQRLDLSSARCQTSEVIAALIKASSLESLHELDLMNLELSHDQLMSILGAPQFQTLKWLRVEFNDLSDESLVALQTFHEDTGCAVDVLGQGSPLPAVSHGDSDGLVSIRVYAGMQSQGLSENSLYTLDSPFRLDDGEWNANPLVGEFSDKTTLRELHFEGLSADNDEPIHLMAPFVSSHHLTYLREMTIGSDCGDVNGLQGILRALGNNPSLAQLETLRVFECEFGDAEAQALAKASLFGLRGLRRFGWSCGTYAIHPIKWTDEGMRILAESPLMNTLKEWSFDEWIVDDFEGFFESGRAGFTRHGLDLIQKASGCVFTPIRDY